MSLTSETQRQLNILAVDLERNIETILENWRQRSERDPALETVARLSRTQFIDHIPQVIKSFCTNLRAEKSQTGGKEATQSHSTHRWQQGYDLRALSSEWGNLNAALVETLEDYQTQNPTVERATLAEARRILADLIHENLAWSVGEFYQLLEAEAATRVRELELGLKHLHEMEQVRGEFLRMTTHDLRGSLNVVSGTAAVIENSKLGEDDRAKFTHMMRKGTSALEQMLGDLMDMSRLEAGQETLNIKHFDVGAMLTDLCRTSESLAAERGLYLKFDGPENLTVMGDATKIRRITQNLLLNALKYTQQGGVTVKWTAPAEKRWTLFVADTGPGLQIGTAVPLAQKLEEATATAHEIEGKPGIETPPENKQEKTAASYSKTAGEGIGLLIVKRLCEFLDATLELESQPEVGTSFKVFFPDRYE